MPVQPGHVFTTHDLQAASNFGSHGCKTNKEQHIEILPVSVLLQVKVTYLVSLLLYSCIAMPNLM